MKIALSLNWVVHYVEVTTAELDTLNKVLCRARSADYKYNEATGEQDLHVSATKLDFKVNVLRDDVALVHPTPTEE